MCVRSMGRSTRFFCNKYVIVVFSVWSCMLLIYYSSHASLILTFSRRFSILGSRVYEDESNTLVTAKQQLACVQPKLDINDPTMVSFLTRHQPTVCQEEPDWVTVNNGTVVFTQPAVSKYGTLLCDYYPVVRENDEKINWGTPITNISSRFNITTDFFKILCKAKNNRTYEGVHMGVAYTEDRANRKVTPSPNGMDGLSIAVLGFDSMSRMSWLRRLPKTREYFYETLGAIELEAHNVVGDGTTAVMLPMLTGKFEWELPDCRRNFKGARPLDKFPFLWNTMKNLGYLTSWCNGRPISAPFNYRMMGFVEQPTDFYTRSFYLAAAPYLKRYSWLCIGSRSQSKVWLDYFRDIFLMYKNKPKFLVHFVTEFTHDDNNLITAVDEDLERLITLLYSGGYLNNTVLILMGDHGARYGKLRSYISGKLEERLPYFSFLFPDWFKKKYPEAIHNLRMNSKRLTTPFDIHETFKEILLNFTGTGLGNVSDRGISLFKEIPPERSCQHAGIAPHWCACLAWQNVSVTEETTMKALEVALETINNKTEKYRDLCALLFVDNVTMAIKLETRSEVLKFKKADGDGGIYHIDLTDTSKNEIEMIQLTFQTTPGGGHFEVTVTHNIREKKMFVNDKEISRINKYGKDPACILDKNRQIRQYCYCKKSTRH